MKFFKEWTHTGIRFPYAYDPVENKPSITLLFPYITFVIMVISVICLHIFSNLLPATLVTILIWAVSVIFYRLRKLDKVKISFKKQEIELNDNEKDENEKD